MAAPGWMTAELMVRAFEVKPNVVVGRCGPGQVARVGSGGVGRFSSNSRVGTWSCVRANGNGERGEECRRCRLVKVHLCEGTNKRRGCGLRCGTREVHLLSRLFFGLVA